MLAQPVFEWRPQLDDLTVLGWSMVAFTGWRRWLARGRRFLVRRGRTFTPKRAGREWAAPRCVVLAVGALLSGSQQAVEFANARSSPSVGIWPPPADGRLAAGGAVGAQRRVRDGLWLLLVWLAARYRDFFRPESTRFWGRWLLGVFVALCAATINHADRFSPTSRTNIWLLEIWGSLLIGIGAAQSRQPSET